jgi:hypothetical protein
MIIIRIYSSTVAKNALINICSCWCFKQHTPSSNGVDNVRLIEVNEAIRTHGVEVVGKKLRGYMTDMKKINQENL